MAGIVSYGAYIPYYRLERKKMAEAFGERAMVGERAVANFDEDSVSMSVNAALDCLQEFAGREVDGVFFATTTAAYEEKQAAGTVAAALDLKSNVRVADVTGSLRASSAAMLSALDMVRAGAKGALAVTADCRLGAPQGQNEQLFGDGAAAFLFGSGDDVIAKAVAVHSHSREQIGGWRNKGDKFVHSWEERFVQTVYGETVGASVRGVLETAGMQPGDFSRIVMAGPAPKAQMAIAGMLGFQKEQFQDPLTDSVGMTGTAHAPMMLVAALEQARPGDKILFVSFGEGSDAIVFEVTAAIERLPRRLGISGHLASKSNLIRYADYLKWRGVLPAEPPRRPETPRPSVTAMQRNYHQNLALYGSKCLECGTPQFPKQRVCVQCQAKDRMEDYRFYGKTARIATYTIDYLAASPAPPTVVAVVDFEGGGRIMCEVTDCDPAEVRIGMELEMTFRRLYQAGGIHNYFWKAKPYRRVAEHEQRNHR
ncbi:OB-fold domain-containing protein [Effusibacillus lacus]|uniref:3-hydroxy-3-methylglutaryl CoA synthase n=1 Tax=Effusibacillus lacus TaxID=1348429 RepID=A0A292YF49_9BACL|nr:OB-fold domain-containing protein [Effusibacillus lacus]TCS74573.1 3-hydroxy-3-methylglutaryl CoA synthase [Effusibacillus lacus]GAX88447.1 3-hydroxy-3-methylglutaryl CoA synthase [Effusibacillus lacus]